MAVSGCTREDQCVRLANLRQVPLSCATPLDSTFYSTLCAQTHCASALHQQSHGMPAHTQHSIRIRCSLSK